MALFPCAATELQKDVHDCACVCLDVSTSHVPRPSPSYGPTVLRIPSQQQPAAHLPRARFVAMPSSTRPLVQH